MVNILQQKLTTHWVDRGMTIQTKPMLFTVFFLILFVTRDVHTQCTGVSSNVTVALLESANFTSPGYPNIYGTNLNCVWFYNSGLGDNYFLVQIKDVYVDCSGDGIRLTDLQSGVIVVDNVCGDGVDTRLISVSARLRIDFTADGNSRSTEDRGFRLLLTGVPNTDTALSICSAPSTIAATEEDQVLISDNFPESYPGLDCQLTIAATPGRKIQITIDMMDLEGDGTTCQYDFLQFLDETGNQIGIYCGQWQFRPVINSVLILNGDTDIKFKSDDADNFLGFKLRFKLAESSTTTVTTSTTTTPTTPTTAPTTTTTRTTSTTIPTSTTTPTTPTTTQTTTTPTTSTTTPTAPITTPITPITTPTTRISTTTSKTVTYSQTSSTTSKTTLTTLKSSVSISAGSVTPPNFDSTLLPMFRSLTEKPASDCGMINCIIPIMTVIGLLLSLMFCAMTVFCVSKKKSYTIPAKRPRQPPSSQTVETVNENLYDK